MRANVAALLFWAGIAATGTAHALDYRSVIETTVLYDAPSQKASPLYVVLPGTPIEVIVVTAGWIKIRDAAGDIAWIESRVVADRRTVIVTAPLAEVRENAAPVAPIVFEAEKDVVLELEEGGPAGWAKVRHPDGETGFVRLDDIWGV